MECLLPYLSMVTVPHIMVGLERMLNYRDIRLERFHCILYSLQNWTLTYPVPSLYPQNDLEHIGADK